MLGKGSTELQVRYLKLHKMAAKYAATSAHRIEVSRLICEGYPDSLFAWTKYEGGRLNLQVSDGKSKSWKGTCSQEHLEAMAEESNMSLQEYVDESVRALSHCQDEDLVFICSAECSESGMLCLTWKKELSDGVRFRLGSVELVPSDVPTTSRCLLDYCVDKMPELLQKVINSEKECSRLERERKSALDLLEKCTTLKEQAEKELYGKFKLVLNEKKSKIRKLMEIKEHLTEQNEEMQRIIWDLKSAAQSSEERQNSPEDALATREAPAIPGPAARVHKTNNTMRSLLSDAGACRPPSPPPVKRQRISKPSERGKIELPHPPPLRSKAKPQDHSKEVKNESDDLSIDANELLDMM